MVKGGRGKMPDEGEYKFQTTYRTLWKQLHLRNFIFHSTGSIMDMYAGIKIRN